ncbi:Non-structural maintenance of chromosomes element 4-like A [Holothuria leucospilota]|uniref:Non-structural maintenance of chromosomes element 4 n=1 Tax=Holothuria leucospilota TaxID=206669 RepID=A0A9Q0YQ35_HOLLE|nr:Non-structural maintenance of chromosomes element 4-like A [Holothuria leucospilota]
MEDPGGDPNRRRQIRHEYRDLILQLSQQEGENAESLSKTLATADKLYEEVLKTKSAREAALDAAFLRTASTLTYQNAQKLIVDNKFEPKVFSEKLVTLLMGRRTEPNSRTQREVAIKKEAWSRFGKDVNSCFRRAPPFHFMLGSFDRGPPIKKVKNTSIPKKPEGQGPTVRPNEIKETNKSQQEVTSEEVERMLGILHQLVRGDDDPVSFFDFVVNPQSFSHTIENIFHMSFLVKDGHVKIELDDDGLPVIYRSKPFDPQEHRGEVPRKQLILSMDMEEWKEIVEVFEITEPLIPPRVTSPKKR